MLGAAYKSELIRGPGQGPWKSVEDVELTTLGWGTGTTPSAFTSISATFRRQSSRRLTSPTKPTTSWLES